MLRSGIGVQGHSLIISVLNCIEISKGGREVRVWEGKGIRADSNRQLQSQWQCLVRRSQPRWSGSGNESDLIAIFSHIQIWPKSWAGQLGWLVPVDEGGRCRRWIADGRIVEDSIRWWLTWRVLKQLFQRDNLESVYCSSTLYVRGRKWKMDR